MVTDAVLVADVGCNLAKDLRQLALEAREVGPPSGECRECSHLVVGLQVVHVIDRNAHAVRCDSSSPFRPLSWREANADGINGYVFCGLHLLKNLIEMKLAESVHPGRYQNDVLLAFNTVDSIQRVEQGVEQIGLGKARHA